MVRFANGGTNHAAELESNGVKFNFFADDRVIYTADHNVDTIIQKLQDRVDRINKRFRDWNLTINGSKSDVIFFR